MPPGLESLPEDVIEQIAHSLDLGDICNLRRCSRGLATKSSGPPFQQSLKDKHVALDTIELRKFMQSMQAVGLHSLIQNFYLDGIANEEEASEQRSQNDSGEDTQRAEEATLLSQIFDELVRSMPDGVLPSLVLRVVVFRGDERILPVDALNASGPLSKALWRCTNDTFDVALQALAISKLQIKGLDIFSDPSMERCSLSCEQLSRINLNDYGLASSLAPLRSLSISISTPVIESDFRVPESLGPRRFNSSRFRTQPQPEREGDFVGLANLLRPCSRIEELEIHFLALEHKATYYYQRFRAERIFQRLMQLDQLPLLNRLRLSGVIIREEDLLDLIRRSRPSELCLENIHLQPGTFKALFEHCTSSTAALSRVYFNGLYEMVDVYGSMVRFVPQASSQAEVAREDLRREGTSIRSPITYRIFRLTVSARPSGSVKRWAETTPVLTAGQIE